jgi:hypothetical protein
MPFAAFEGLRATKEDDAFGVDGSEIGTGLMGGARSLVINDVVTFSKCDSPASSAKILA